LSNFRPDELRAVLQRWVACGAVAVPLDSFDEFLRRVSEQTYALPQEVGLLCLKFWKWFEDRRALSAYMDPAQGYYRARLQNVPSKNGLGQELLQDSISFAADLYIGAPVLRIPESWQIAGLLSKEKCQLLTASLSCCLSSFLQRLLPAKCPLP